MMKSFIKYLILLVFVYEYKGIKCLEECPSDAVIGFFWSGYKYILCSDKNCTRDRYIGPRELAEAANLLTLEFCEYLPRCAMHKLYNLEIIYGVNADMNSLAPMSLRGLSKLEEINLSFNYLKEIHLNVFAGLDSVQLVDLSWNDIIFVEQGAFDEMKSLQKLNLSRNCLKTLAGNLIFIDRNERGQYAGPGDKVTTIKKGFETKVRSIDLSYNNMKYVKCFAKRDIRVLNLSHNKIKSFMLSSYSIDRIDYLDLTDNKLLSCNFSASQAKFSASRSDDRFINTLKISYNEIKDLDCSLEQIYNIALEGNPWRCDDYTNILKILIKNNVNLIKDESVYFLNDVERRNYPYCSVADNSNQEVLQRFIDLKEVYRKGKNPPCRSNDNCPGSMVCKNYQCWDPCKYDVCHPTSICVTKNHKFLCQCPEGTLKSPYKTPSRCYRVECFETTDCDVGAKCVQHICAHQMEIRVEYGKPRARLAELVLATVD